MPPATRSSSPTLFPDDPPDPERCPRCRAPLATEPWGDRRCLFCGNLYIRGGDGVLRLAADVMRAGRGRRR